MVTHPDKHWSALMRGMPIPKAVSILAESFLSLVQRGLACTDPGKGFSLAVHKSRLLIIAKTATKSFEGL